MPIATLLDLGVLGLFLILLIRGFYRGVIREIVMIFGMPAAVMVSVILAPALRPALFQIFGASYWAHLLVYPVVFVIFLIALRLLAEIIARLLQWTGVGLLDRLMGLFLGGVEGVLVAGALGAVILAAPRGEMLIGQTHVLKYLVPIFRGSVAMGQQIARQLGIG